MSMSVISDGTPMTNGEVFALLRRRRDERNARLLPPFGLPRGSPQSAQSPAPVSAGSAFGTAGNGSALFSPPPALLHAGSGNGSVDAPVGNGALFTSPAAAHLSVLLHEVRALRYLSGRAAVSGADVRDVYGPTSLYRRGAAAIAPFRPGTVGHVRAVDAALAEWESKGRAAEASAAEGIKTALRRASGANAYSGGKDGSHLAQEEPQRMFAKPSVPLRMFAAPKGAAGRGAKEWDAADVLRLVMARPRSSLDVHRVLDGISAEDESDEAAVEEAARLEEEILRVFADVGKTA